MSAGLDLGGSVFTVSANVSPFVTGLKNAENLGRSFTRRLAYIETLGTKTFRTLGSSISMMNRSLMGGIGTLSSFMGVGLVGFGALAGASVKMASDMTEVQNKFDVVFGDTAKASQEKLYAFGREVGRSRMELLAMAADFKGVTRQFAGSEQATSDLAVQLAKLAVDLGSLNNTTDAEAAERLQSGLIGNHEALRKLNIFISEASIKQELFRMGIKKSVDVASDQEKQMARLSIIMRTTELAQGDATRTSGSFSNQIKALWAAIKDTGAELGAAFIPTLQLVIDAFLDMIAVLRDHSASIQEWGAAFAVVVGNIFGFMRELAFAVYNYDLSWQALKLTVVESFTHMYERIAWFVEAVIGGFEWLFSHATDLVLTHANNVLSIYINLGTNIVRTFQEVWDYIASGGADAVDATYKGLMEGWKDYDLSGLKEAMNPEFKESDFTAQRRALEDEWIRRRQKLDKTFDRQGRGQSDRSLKLGDAASEAAKKTKVQVEIVANEQLFRKALTDNLKNSQEAKALAVQEAQLTEQKGTRADSERQTKDMIQAFKDTRFGFV